MIWTIVLIQNLDWLRPRQQKITLAANWARLNIPILHTLRWAVLIRRNKNVDWIQFWSITICIVHCTRFSPIENKSIASPFSSCKTEKNKKKRIDLVLLRKEIFVVVVHVSHWIATLYLKTIYIENEARLKPMQTLACA